MASRYICLICRNPIPHAGAECPHCKSRAAAVVGATPRMLAAMFAVMVVFFYVVHLYNREFNRERLHRAEEHFLHARTLADYGYFEEAAANYRDALAHDRDRFEYRLGLALALYSLGRFQEAENQLLELRGQRPTDAEVNRLLARLARRDGRYEEAANFYRNAVYGRWPRDPEANRLDTRLELIELLETRGGRLQAIGELLSLHQEETRGRDLSERVAKALLDLGAYQEAAAVYRELVEGGASGMAVYGGCGRALFELGRYEEALGYLNRALRRSEDIDLRYFRETAEEVVALDPTPSSLTSRERYRRSREILERTRDYVDFCRNPFGEEFVGPLKPAPEPARTALALAEGALAVERRPDDLNQATEANLMLARNLWSSRGGVCTNVWGEDDALRLVMGLLSR